MDTAFKFVLSAAFMFVGMVVFLEVGRRLGARRAGQDGGGGDPGTGAVDGAVFALFGLLLAFTFSGAASRFDHRRELIVQEANAIGTAYLRLDLLPAASQPALRALFREYVQARIARFEKYADEAASEEERRRAAKLQNDIWRLAVAGVNAAPVPTVAAQLLPALNEMIDITTTRWVALQTHPPQVIFAMLFGLSLVVSLLAGAGMSADKSRRWLHVFAFAGAVTATVYVIMDIEHPRRGLIRIDTVDRLLTDTLESMK